MYHAIVAFLLSGLLLVTGAGVVLAEEGPDEDERGRDGEGRDGAPRRDRSDGGARTPEDARRAAAAFRSEDEAENRAFMEDLTAEHRAFHDAQQAAFASFQENQTAERRAFASTNRTADETEAFAREQASETQAFRETQAEAHREFHEESQEKVREFQDGRKAERHALRDEIHESLARERRHVGEFTDVSGTVGGAFVAFDYDAGNGTLSGFSLGGVEAFREVRVEPFEFERVRVDGASLRIRGDEVDIRAHDTPSAGLRIAPHDGPVTATFVLAPGAVATSAGEDAYVISFGNRTALLAIRGEDDGTGSLALSGDRLVANVSDDAHVVFLARPLHREGAPEVDDAIRKGRVGAQVRFEHAEGRVHQDVFELEGVSVTAAVIGDTANLIISAPDGTPGKVIVVDLDPAVVGAAENGTVNVTIDGRSATPARDFADVLDPDDDAGVPEYLLVRGNEGFQILVSLPHFSVHAVTISSVPILLVQPPPSVVAGVIAAAAVVAVAAGFLFRRPKTR
ncbi:MAG: hypothetical protein ACT4PT_01230 [Methanobacteriota archaeon]